jgi:hypothetical protein
MSGGAKQTNRDSPYLNKGASVPPLCSSIAEGLSLFICVRPGA